MSSDPVNLTRNQFNTTISVLKRINILAKAAAKRRHERSKQEIALGYLSPRRDRDPVPEHTFNFFVVDGERGTGKSTVAARIARYSKYLRDNKSGDNAIWADFARIQKEFADDEKYDGPDGYHPAHVLPTIQPDMTHGRESEMPDVIFDMIRGQLQDIVGPSSAEPGPAYRQKFYFERHLRENQENRRRQEDIRYDPTKNEAQRLLNELQERVDPAWTYARNIGREMLSRDSVSYREFVVRKGYYSSLATERQQLWHDFIEDFLDMNRAELLMVYMDDCDLSPNVARQTLEDLRMYLAHPRVVCVLAMNMDELYRMMRDPLQERYIAFFEATAFMGENRDTGVTGWANPYEQLNRISQDLKKEVEQIHFYLEKTLPVGNRYKLRASDIEEVHAILFKPADDDDEATQESVGKEQRFKDLQAKALRSTPTIDDAIAKSATERWLWWTRYPDAMDGVTLRVITDIRDNFQPENPRKAVELVLQHYPREAELRELETDDLLANSSFRVDDFGAVNLVWKSQFTVEDQSVSPSIAYLMDAKKLADKDALQPPQFLASISAIIEDRLDNRDTDLGFKSDASLGNRSGTLPLNAVAISDLNALGVSTDLGERIFSPEPRRRRPLHFEPREVTDAALNGSWARHAWSGRSKPMGTRGALRYSRAEGSDPRIDMIDHTVILAAMKVAKDGNIPKLSSQSIPKVVKVAAFELLNETGSETKGGAREHTLPPWLEGEISTLLYPDVAIDEDDARIRLTAAIALARRHCFGGTTGREDIADTDDARLAKAIALLGRPFPVDTYDKDRRYIDARDAALFAAAVADSVEIYADHPRRPDLAEAVRKCLDRAGEHPAVSVMPIVRRTGERGTFQALRDAVETAMESPGGTTPIQRFVMDMLGVSSQHAAATLDALDALNLD